MSMRAFVLDDLGLQPSIVAVNMYHVFVDTCNQLVPHRSIGVTSYHMTAKV